MAETNLKLRSPNYKSTRVTAPTAGYTAGQMIKLNDTVMIVVTTVTVGQVSAAIYWAEKVVVPKATGVTFANGGKVYFNSTTGKVTSVASGNTLCGRALAAAASADTEAEIEFNGAVAA